MRNILISGASIAGPALAYWRNRTGFQTTVIERAPAPRPGGQAIDVRGPALTVLDQMGLLDRARGIARGSRGRIAGEGRAVPTSRKRTAHRSDHGTASCEKPALVQLVEQVG
jgi:2-polyprenyl-6-methoxyphenol hydroxylase-like FAD-dependent oxidoreductase